jgi:hypothetical protein
MKFGIRDFRETVEKNLNLFAIAQKYRELCLNVSVGVTVASHIKS